MLFEGAVLPPRWSLATGKISAGIDMVRMSESDQKEILSPREKAARDKADKKQKEKEEKEAREAEKQRAKEEKLKEKEREKEEKQRDKEGKKEKSSKADKTDKEKTDKAITPAVCARTAKKNKQAKQNTKKLTDP